MIPTDPLYAQQWHFPLIGNIRRIWDTYDGTGVNVGVYDDGVEAGHQDLAANYDASLHFVYNGTTYAPFINLSEDFHGTACAGIIASVDGNGVGGVGVAHGARITGVDVFDPTLNANDAIEGAMIRWANNFDIMSNSWNWEPFYDDFQDIGDPGTDHDDYDNWYQTIAQTGRGGLGTVIVQSAGNETMNGNGTGVNVSRFTITVSATESDGFIADYSNFGACVLIAGPASAVTTDLSGNNGYNNSTDGILVPVNYTNDFGGTSAAAPTVSGVIALMLDAAPGLGWRDVQNILALSAGHTGSAYGSGGSGFEVGQWDSNSATTWNGGGSAYHLSYGYGMVDAFAAVRMAEAWLRMSGPAQTSANEVTVSATYNGGVVAIPDLGTASLAINVTSDVEIESIYVTLSVTHSFASDLVLALRAPDGSEIPIFANEGGETLFFGGFEYTFAVEAGRGMSSLGQWRLVAYDSVAGDIGTLLDFDLEFHGRAASTNDIHTFTDDFRALAALEVGRTTFEDLNGGTDWLNFAGLSQAVSGRIDTGFNILVGGVVWGQVTNNGFENVYLGDGNDSLTGGRGNNVMVGGYGNDRLSGFGGNDRVEGGAGNDNVNGGLGNDTVNGGVGADRLTGGAGADTFIFGAGFRRDIITDFVDNVDTIQLSRALWAGNLTVAQVIAGFATVVGTNILFDFGVNELTVNFAVAQNTAIFLDDIVIV